MASSPQVGRFPEPRWLFAQSPPSKARASWRIATRHVGVKLRARHELSNGSPLAGRALRSSGGYKRHSLARPQR